MISEWRGKGKIRLYSHQTYFSLPSPHPLIIRACAHGGKYGWLAIALNTTFVLGQASIVIHLCMASAKHDQSPYCSHWHLKSSQLEWTTSTTLLLMFWSAQNSKHSYRICRSKSRGTSTIFTCTQMGLRLIIPNML